MSDDFAETAVVENTVGGRVTSTTGGGEAKREEEEEEEALAAEEELILTICGEILGAPNGPSLGESADKLASASSDEGPVPTPEAEEVGGDEREEEMTEV